MKVIIGVFKNLQMQPFELWIENGCIMIQGDITDWKLIPIRSSNLVFTMSEMEEIIIILTKFCEKNYLKTV